MKIVCYGDSNTYGWDPRPFSGNHYDHPWPELLRDMTEYNVINKGEPGRMVPWRKEHLDWFCRGISLAAPDMLIIMLGTNDILNMYDPSGKDIAENMDNFVSYIIENRLAERILLLSCPKVEVYDRPYMEGLADLSDRYRKIASCRSIYFADPFSWDIPLAFDGIHFSEEGHRIFAEKILPALRETADES